MANYEIDRERWAQLSIFEQMGNIGAEVGRAVNATRAGKDKRAQGAIDRAVDLLDATVEVLVAQGSPRVKEVLRAREEFLRLFFDGTWDVSLSAEQQEFQGILPCLHAAHG